MRLALAAAAFAVACALSFPVLAAPVCQFTLDEATAGMDERGTAFVVLTPEERATFLKDLAAAIEIDTGKKPDLSAITDVLIAEIDGELFFGVVVDGCLTPPQPIAAFLPAEKRSGKTPFGVFA